MNQYLSYQFSIVIPTYQRRDVVLASVQALNNQEFKGSFDVVVVVDGSQDGTEESLQALETSFTLKVIKQVNQGAATARNRGVAEANGEIIFFLDDDMEAHPQLLIEHDRSYQEGADVVLGHIPLHSESPTNFLSSGIERWAQRRTNSLSSPDVNFTFRDILSGHISMKRAVFQTLGGFDTNFTKGGSFGCEDSDFGIRLLKTDYKIVFNANAISWQRYVVTPAQYLRQYRQGGRAAVILARKHPDQVQNIFDPSRAELFMDRVLWRWFRVPIRWLVLLVLGTPLGGYRTIRLFFWLWKLEYCQGVREAGGIPQPRPLRILCYHAISDLKDAPIIENYGIPPQQFRQQLESLEKTGFNFISVNEFWHFLQGKGGLPPKPILVSFDDCYQDLLDQALPILEEKRIPAIAFAISQRLGRTNEWDQPLGAPELRLLNQEGLIKVAAKGVAIGSHSRTHPKLTRISPAQLSEEVRGSLDDLQAIGLSRPLFFAYPYGVYDDKVQKAMKEAGLQGAFTIKSGMVPPNQNPYEIPRIEVLREDVGWLFLAKVGLAGRFKQTWKSWQSFLKWLRKFR